MSNDDSDEDNILGALALTALVAGGAWLLGQVFGASSEDTVVEAKPDYMQSAYIHMQKGAYAEAIEAAQHAIEVNSDDPEPYNLIGWILAINNQALDQAFEGARKAISLASGLDTSYLANYYDTLAEVYRLMGHLDEAISCFRESLRLDPNGDEKAKDFSPSFRLAVCYLIQGRSNDALFFLNRALQVQPQNPLIYQVMGDYCFQIQHYTQAIQYFQAALHLSQQWTTFHYPLIGNFDIDGERHICQSMCWTNIGATYFYLREYKQSREANENASSLYNFLPHPWINLAVLAAHNKNERQVRQYLETGLPMIEPFRDGQLQTYLITTQDFGEYRFIMLDLLKSHGFISDITYRSLSTSTPQGGAVPLAFSNSQINTLIVGQATNFKGGSMSNYDQKGQQVGTQNFAGRDFNIGTQNIAGRDFNSNPVQDKRDLIAELEKLQEQLRKAKSDRVIEGTVVTEVNHELELAKDQADSLNPRKQAILDHLKVAKELIQDIAAATGVVSTLVELAKAVPHLF